MTLFGPDAVRNAFFHPPTLPVVEFIALADQRDPATGNTSFMAQIPKQIVYWIQHLET